MVYPVVIMSVAAIAIAVLLIFVIPTFQKMFASVNMELPLPTRIVIGMSGFLTSYWWAASWRSASASAFVHQALLRHDRRPEDASTA